MIGRIILSRFVNNIYHNYYEIHSRDFIFSMHIPLIFSFLMTPMSMSLWPWPFWTLFPRMAVLHKHILFFLWYMIFCFIPEGFLLFKRAISATSKSCSAWIANEDPLSCTSIGTKCCHLCLNFPYSGSTFQVSVTLYLFRILPEVRAWSVHTINYFNVLKWCKSV